MTELYITAPEGQRLYESQSWSFCINGLSTIHAMKLLIL